MFSAHDVTMANIWEFLEPVNFDYNYIPYSSYLQIKLWEEKKCQDDTHKDDECFMVTISTNN